jgi:hypothetical protein
MNGIGDHEARPRRRKDNKRIVCMDTGKARIDGEYLDVFAIGHDVDVGV